MALLAFDEFIFGNDRVSFMTFTRNTYVKFSSVEKKKNTENLRNQIACLKKECLNPNFFKKMHTISKAIRESLSMFSLNYNANWILIFTCGCAEGESAKSIEYLRNTNVNIIMVDMKGSGDDSQLCKIAGCTREGMYMEVPTIEQFKLAMHSICSIAIPLQPVIIQLFT